MNALLKDCIALAKVAGEAILPYYQQIKPEHITTKPDKSPVTVADIAAHDVLVAGLKKLTPDYPVLSEEGDIPDFNVRQQWERYWLLDPLDGTRGFVKHSPEFSVNIALIENHQPILGVITAPATGACYAAAKGEGAWTEGANGKLSQIHSTAPHREKVRFAVGKFHGSKRLSKVSDVLGDHELLKLNSSLKFGLIAGGQADVYLRFGPTSEWDTAAGQIILEEAGGLVVDFNGQPLHYNAKSSLTNAEFLAIGDPSWADTLITLLNQKGE